ncbi:helix-turn-helix domain-containing protein [Arthrobacter sp. R-11]|uniref:helix-turn-helix domain-containing protein n=1 Tax=Arthrobacter sp. R-11 TaxID=3404053 RepID=UPI003CFBB203
MGSVTRFPVPGQPEQPPATEAIRLYTVNEAADLLGVSEFFVRSRIEDGSLRSVDLATNVRKKFRVRADDLNAFIDAHTEGAA